MRVKTKKGNGKIASFASGISGFASFLGNYQICHNLCLSIIALFSFAGITLAGMPLLFLIDYADKFWYAAVILTILSLVIQVSMHILNSKMLLANFGILLASIPFKQFNDVRAYLWLIGSSMILAAILLFIKERYFAKGKVKQKGGKHGKNK